MQELIKTQQVNNRITVLARDLYEFLEVGTEFAKWMQRMCEYGFNEKSDYEVIVKNDDNLKGGRPSTDYQLTLEMAKEIAMIQRSEKGKQARQYFIACEKELKEGPRLPTTPMEVMKLMFDAMTDTNREVKDLSTRLDVVELSANMTWRDRMLKEVEDESSKQGKLPMVFLGELYLRVEENERCNLDVRLMKLKNRRKQAGATFKECKSISKIDVISSNKKLMGACERCFKSMLEVS